MSANSKYILIVRCIKAVGGPLMFVILKVNEVLLR